MNRESFQEAERQLWATVGAEPTEHRVRLERNDVEVRIQEVGQGPPALFLHGGPGAAGSSFAHLAARLPELRCLLLDRPGTGLSGPQPLTSPAAVRREAETLVPDILDALSLDRAHLIGSSHGSYIALLAGAVHPDRVDRTVHLGCPGFIDGMALRFFDRLSLAPGARHVFGLFPANEKALTSVLRQLGHGTSIDAGRIPQAFVDWSVALQRHTDTMRNELESMASMGTFRRGFDPSLTLSPELLGTVRSPTSFLWGADDPFGGETVARRAVEAMPSAQLEIVPDAGHLIWIDDVDHAADVVRRHLGA